MEEIPVYEQEHAIKGIRKFRYYIDQNKFNELKRFCVKTGDIIISCSGTVGEVSVIKDEDPKGLLVKRLLILRATRMCLSTVLKVLFDFTLWEKFYYIKIRW